MTARTPQRQQLLDLLGPVVTSVGYDLEDVTVTAAGRRSLIRVIVDSDQGIDLDAVAEVSRAVSDSLDAADSTAFAGPYVLEVSSPGVDRPLTEARHWRRAVGRLVTVPVGDKTITGRVVSADSDVTLEVNGVPETHPLSELGKGKIQVEFNRGVSDDELAPLDDDGDDEDFADEGEA